MWKKNFFFAYFMIHLPFPASHQLKLICKLFYKRLFTLRIYARAAGGVEQHLGQYLNITIMENNPPTPSSLPLAHPFQPVPCAQNRCSPRINELLGRQTYLQQLCEIG